MFRTTVDLNQDVGTGFGYWCYGDASGHMDLIWFALL